MFLNNKVNPQGWSMTPKILLHFIDSVMVWLQMHEPQNSKSLLEMIGTHPDETQ